MITVGLIKELQFISLVLKTPIKISWQQKYILNIRILNNILYLDYKGIPIWQEDISDNGFFGVESCDTIARIIYCINNDQPYFQYLNKLT